jgi:hypothetical protein
MALVVAAGSRPCHAVGPSRSVALTIQASTLRDRHVTGAVGTRSSQP